MKTHHRPAYITTDPAMLRLANACESRELTTWETEFVASLRSRYWPPTEKQMAILRRIAEGAPDYAAIKRAATAVVEDLVNRWLPDGKKVGHEYVALNPKRSDTKAGSFTINLNTGEWADFATADRGGDPISLAAFLFGLSQAEAARKLGVMLGLMTEGGAHG